MKKLLGYVDLTSEDLKHKIDCRLYTHGDLTAELEIQKNKKLALMELKITKEELPKHKIKLYKVYIEECK